MKKAHCRKILINVHIERVILQSMVCPIEQHFTHAGNRCVVHWREHLQPINLIKRMTKKLMEYMGRDYTISTTQIHRIVSQRWFFTHFIRHYLMHAGQMVQILDAEHAQLIPPHATPTPVRRPPAPVSEPANWYVYMDTVRWTINVYMVFWHEEKKT